MLCKTNKNNIISFVLMVLRLKFQWRMGPGISGEWGRELRDSTLCDLLVLDLNTLVVIELLNFCTSHIWDIWLSSNYIGDDDLWLLL